MIVFPYQLYQYDVTDEGRILQKFKKTGHDEIVKVVIEKGEIISLSNEKYRASLKDEMIKIRMEGLKELSIDMAFLHEMRKVSEININRNLPINKKNQHYVHFHLIGVRQELAYIEDGGEKSIVINKMENPRVKVTQVIHQELLQELYNLFQTLK